MSNNINDSIALKQKSVYYRAVIYFCTDIDYSNKNNLDEKIEAFKSNICSSLDDICIDNGDFAYEGVDIIDESEIPSNILDTFNY